MTGNILKFSHCAAVPFLKANFDELCKILFGHVILNLRFLKTECLDMGPCIILFTSSFDDVVRCRSAAKPIDFIFPLLKIATSVALQTIDGF